MAHRPNGDASGEPPTPPPPAPPSFFASLARRRVEQRRRMSQHTAGAGAGGVSDAASDAGATALFSSNTWQHHAQQFGVSANGHQTAVRSPLSAAPRPPSGTHAHTHTHTHAHTQPRSPVVGDGAAESVAGVVFLPGNSRAIRRALGGSNSDAYPLQSPGPDGPGFWHSSSSVGSLPLPSPASSSTFSTPRTPVRRARSPPPARQSSATAQAAEGVASGTLADC